MRAVILPMAVVMSALQRRHHNGHRRGKVKRIRTTMTTIPCRFLLAAIVLSVCAVVARAQQSPHLSSGYIPHRVYKSGEQHDDPATHRIERAILEGLARRRGNVVVALEMFERDTQSSLDEYLAGHLNEEDFLKASRPWPRYMTDYRPLVEFARVHGWRVIASNTPRRIAVQVSREGLAAARPDSESERKLVASDISCPLDDYFKRFAEVMSKGHPGAHENREGEKQTDKKQEEERRAALERFFYAQCVKDETMAESITNALSAPGTQSDTQGGSLVVHFNGAFHSDYRLGTASRAIRRAPKSKVKVISVVPVENLDAINVDEYRKRGDYIIFTLKPPTSQ